MESILNAESLRTIIILVGMIALFIRLESKFDRKFVNLERRLDRFETDIDRRFDKSETDINSRFDKFEADVNRRFDRVEAIIDRRFDSIKELTYVLNKGGIITDKDKKHVDSYLKEGVTAWN
ncbi:MAG: hypothetical protein FWC23_02370 [Chitinispirillia bacterium]|nr:hypothetical protein [Chitinispirillia bacterium]MCL2268024.1 hypothetical protein [Chitinispirillia bacterium]